MQAAKTVDLVFVGGGHSHALVLRQLAMNPIAGVNITLISDRGVTPYSGMLPAYLAGKYSYEECHIDLRKLMHAVGGQFWVDSVTGIDPTQRRLYCQQHPPLRYDWLSLDTGSTPVLPKIPGAQDHGIPVKPWQPFLDSWQRWMQELQRSPRPTTLVIVGGGAGGVELALNAEAKFAEILGEYSWTIHLIQRGRDILAHHNAWVRERCTQLLQQRHIQVHLECEVSQIQAGHLTGSSGLKIEFDQLFWVTGAAAPDWLQSTGLQLNDTGFIQVGDDLRSLSHPNIFAAGDVATMVNHPRPKAGVFAVRQGKPLAENIRRVLAGLPTVPFEPQRHFLSLIGTGNDRAIASWGKVPIGLETAWLWDWKDKIDRKFMDQFENLSAGMGAMTQARSHQADSPPESMHCAGCGSKVGGAVLSSVLSEIQTVTSPDVIIGLEGEDAAVVTVPPGKVMVHTVDYFRQIISDPFLFGQIATHHALSDLYAMGATPQTALAIATIPYGTSRIQKNMLRQLLSGAVHVLNQAGAALVGGHTTEGPELAFGLSCNGLASPEQLLRKNGLKGGETLILTQALGTGVIFAEPHTVKSAWIDQALIPMLQSNQTAGQIAQEIGATACTDITGFGLLGHLWEMAQASQVAVTLNLDCLPILSGALELSHQGVRSSLFEQNAEVQRFTEADPSLKIHPHWPLLFDPQTSGGLLIAVPTAQAENCCQKLIAAGYRDSQAIATVTVGETKIRLQS